MPEDDRGPSDTDVLRELRKKLEWLLTGVPEERQSEMLENLFKTKVPFYVV